MSGNTYTLIKNELHENFHLPCTPYWKLGETPCLLLCYGNQEWRACRSDWYNAFSWFWSSCLFHSRALRRDWWNWTWTQQGYSLPMHLLRKIRTGVSGLRQITDVSCLNPQLQYPACWTDLKRKREKVRRGAQKQGAFKFRLASAKPQTSPPCPTFSCAAVPCACVAKAVSPLMPQ